MKTIIIPTDFSPAASNATQYGVDMAIAINASVTLLHVYNIPIAVGDVPVALLSVDELKDAAEQNLNRLKKDLEHVTSGKIKIYAEARLGNVVDELEDLCNKIHPFAVIMGTTGTSAVERTLFGSNALTAIKHLTYPVICVPKGKEYGNGVHKIGLACDFKEVAETTPVNEIKDFVKEFHAQLFVLNVDYDNRQFTADTPEQSVLLHTALEEVHPEYHFITHKDIENGINEFAETHNLDLIIAIPKKHKILDGLFRKSSTSQLVFESHVPVMCVHE
ncbi:MAG TPA: universal stress protein [Chitinophagaceae bacterium]|nr:universal stress protein [Chitinophagaceae bacterium]